MRIVAEFHGGVLRGKVSIQKGPEFLQSFQQVLLGDPQGTQSHHFRQVDFPHDFQLPVDGQFQRVPAHIIRREIHGYRCGLDIKGCPVQQGIGSQDIRLQLGHL